MSEPITCVLFDLDGTLADTAPGYIVAFNALLVKHGKLPVDDDSIRQWISAGARSAIKYNWQADITDDEVDSLREEFLDLYHSRPELCQPPEVMAYQGVPDLLSQLKASELTLGVVTNKTRRLATPILQALSMDTRFDVVLGPEDFINFKPAPDGLLQAMDRLGHPPGQCIYIGDHLKDIQAAAAAGIRSIAVGYGFAPEQDDYRQWPANYHADSVTSLSQQLHRLLNEDQ